MSELKALVTGGSGDIGSAICKRLAGRGIHVLVHANSNITKAASVAQSIMDHGGSAETVSFDLTNIESTGRALKKIMAQGPIQILVNNAGIHRDAPMAGMNQADWQSVVDVSLNGFFNVTRPLLMQMIRTRWGRIINMSSVAGIAGNRGQVNYAAAKSALHGATKSLAIELASRGITVNAIAPGIIEGQMSEANFDKALIKTIVPMKRAGTPNDVAALVDFLCSDDAGYISGQIVSVNGAMF